MSKIGRNDLCPCGSGLKYKKCCLLRQRQEGRFFTGEERESATQKLEMVLDDPRLHEIEDEASLIFSGPFREALTEHDDDYVGMTSQMAYDQWLFFDYRLKNGHRVVDYLLDDPSGLTPGERYYLEQGKKTCLRLYEVVQVVPGTSLTLRDLLNKREIQVQEKLGSQNIQKWDLLAARVMPIGKSGQPEMEGGSFSLPRMLREGLLTRIKKEYKDFFSKTPGANELMFFETLAPFLHQAWLQPYLAPVLPRIIDTEGNELHHIQSFFDVKDTNKLLSALNSSLALERVKNEWEWNRPDSGQATEKDNWIGSLKISGDLLILKTMTEAWAERGRAFIEEIAKDAVQYRIGSRQSLEQALADPKIEPREELDPFLPELMEAKAAFYQQHYRQWLDDKIPALDGHTPRLAAKSPGLRPRLIEMLKDLENLYQTSLKQGSPGFDPFWMWDELNLADHQDAPGRPGELPLTGYESLARQIPGLEELARECANRFRQQPAFEESMTITHQELEGNLDFHRFLRNQALEEHQKGASADDAVVHANLIGSHLGYMCNFELHRRKIFWVEESCAWMLAQTDINVTGEFIRLPFPSFALAFTDRYTLGLAEAMLAADQNCQLRGQILKMATVYIHRLPAGPEARAFKVAFTFDALAGQWPYLISRDLHFSPESGLEEIIDSHFPEIEANKLDPMFSSLQLKKLLKLVINAILYTTSTGIEKEYRPAKGQIRTRRKSTGDQALDSSEDVFYLPGKIDISHLRQMQKIERAPGGGKLMNRFMVRGHWRKANPSWKDQSPRWIKPYWKGPDIGAVIERAYRLKA